MSMFTRHFLFDHFQFALIHGPNIPGSYVCAHIILLIDGVCELLRAWVLEPNNLSSNVNSTT